MSGFDKSAARVAPVRSLEVRANHEGPGFLLVACEKRPDAGYKSTLLNVTHPLSKVDAIMLAAATSRCVEALTGVVYTYPGQNGEAHA